MSLASRDFLGGRGQGPVVTWPGQARLAVSFVLNFEEGAELSIADGDERNEPVYEVREEVIGAPDPDPVHDDDEEWSGGGRQRRMTAQGYDGHAAV